MSETTEAVVPLEPKQTLVDAVRERWNGVRAGDVGSLPIILALIVIAVFFDLKNSHFNDPGNVVNLIIQMAGFTTIGLGVVFVLLLGEIDLSVGYVSGVCGVIAAKFTEPPGTASGWPIHVNGLVAIAAALAAGATIGLFQGAIVVKIGVPSFVVTLAGLQIWNGVVFKALPGVITIQSNKINDFSNYLFSPTNGWIIAAIVSVLYVALTLWSAVAGLRHGVPVRDPVVLVFKVVLVPAVAFVTVWILNKPGSGGVPLGLLMMVGALIVLTFLAKRTTFGRHVYAVGGSAEGARRAGINVARIRIIVFMISGLTAGLGGIVLAARLQSVDLQAGSGTLLLEVISAAVIGGTSLFGGRGEVRNALIGAALIYTIESGMFIKGYATGIIYIVTGVILLLAVTFDTIVRRIQVRSGR